MSTCRLFHDWAPWGEPQRGERTYNGQHTGLTVWAQFRKCNRCGKVEMSEIV